MDVSTEINQILVRIAEVDADKPGYASMKFSDLGLDSLAIMEAIYEIEAQLGIELEDSQLLELRSISDLVDAVTTQLNHTA